MRRWRVVPVAIVLGGWLLLPAIAGAQATMDFAYTRAIDLMAFAGGEYFADDPDHAAWNIHRVATFAVGSVQQDTVAR